MATFRYTTYSIMSERQLASSLVMNDPQWTEVVNGNAGFSGAVTVPDRLERDRVFALRAALEPREAALYVQDEAGNYVFGGPIIQRKWSPEKRQIEVSAVHWRSWFYSVMLTPAQDGSGDILYSWTAQDQTSIAADLFEYALIGGATDGRPPFAGADCPATGKTRDLSVKGLDFKYVGDLLDSVGSRDGGFEWGVTIDRGLNGTPVIRPYTAFPQEGGLVTGLMFSTGSNILEYSEIVEDASGERTRVWSVGDGEPVPYAYDQDSAIGAGAALLAERSDNYSRVVRVDTLASHSRAMREYLSSPFNLYTFSTHLNAPPVGSYRAGDRGRLILKDDWYNLDLPAVRIIQKTVKPAEQKVEITVDMNDMDPPEVDEEGVE